MGTEIVIGIFIITRYVARILLEQVTRIVLLLARGGKCDRTQNCATVESLARGEESATRISGSFEPVAQFSERGPKGGR